MSVFQCLSCQHTSFPVTREMVRLKPCALCASEVRYACQCCINHQRRWAKGQIQSHRDQWTFFFFFIESHELWTRSRWMSELCQPHWETVVQTLACCLASRKRKVKQRLADVSSTEGILMSASRISQRDPARWTSCFSAWRQSRSQPTSHCYVWGHPLPPETIHCASGHNGKLNLLPFGTTWEDVLPPPLSQRGKQKTAGLSR